MKELKNLQAVFDPEVLALAGFHTAPRNSGLEPRQGGCTPSPTLPGANVPQGSWLLKAGLEGVNGLRRRQGAGPSPTEAQSVPRTAASVPGRRGRVWVTAGSPLEPGRSRGRGRAGLPFRRPPRGAASPRVPPAHSLGAPSRPGQGRGRGRGWAPRGLPRDPPRPARCPAAAPPALARGSAREARPGGSPEEAAGRPRGPEAPAAMNEPARGRAPPPRPRSPGPASRRPRRHAAARPRAALCREPRGASRGPRRAAQGGGRSRGAAAPAEPPARPGVGGAARPGRARGRGRGRGARAPPGALRGRRDVAGRGQQPGARPLSPVRARPAAATLTSRSEGPAPVAALADAIELPARPRRPRRSARGGQSSSRPQAARAAQTGRPPAGHRAAPPPLRRALPLRAGWGGGSSLHPLPRSAARGANPRQQAPGGGGVLPRPSARPQARRLRTSLSPRPRCFQPRSS
ncbi:basic salivary proline-rich protein 2-like [Vulpes lagopus]|uniref:basic salivary proline-rich protein 2-like n=1 Tax=Vulpes lagopus TaxID=494514 RepID=UPI001BC8FEDD|nr:basic salivary proline-rich protein 2-like [Vulpes lagopus]